MGRDGDALWGQFSGRADDDTSDLRSLEKEKCPKPDYAFYFPIYDLDSGSMMIPKVTDPEARQWHQVPNPSLVEPFSWSILQELFRHGLRPTPFRVFHKSPLEASLKCYPWLIVEHKKESNLESTERIVYCQATNAAAGAVQLIHIAARYAAKRPDQAHVAPVPVVTTIGPRVKVWIMYYAENFQAPSTEHWTAQLRWRSCRRGYVSLLQKTMPFLLEVFLLTNAFR